MAGLEMEGRAVATRFPFVDDEVVLVFMARDCSSHRLSDHKMNLRASTVVTIALSFVGHPSEVVRILVARSRVCRWGSHGLVTKSDSVQYSPIQSKPQNAFPCGQHEPSRYIIYRPFRLTQALP